MKERIRPSQAHNPPVSRSVPSIILSNKSKKSNKSSTRFKNLWEKAEKARTANQQLEASLDALVVQVRSEIAPHERLLGLAMRQQVFKLITFSSRKSLLQWQSAILSEWVEELMSTLYALGLVDDELLEHMAKTEAQVLNIPIDENSDVRVADQLAEAFVELFSEESDSDYDEFDDDLDEFFDDERDFASWIEEELRAASLNQKDDAFEHALTDNADESTLKESQSLFKTLFHRAARALHPDKVTDVEEKESRQRLMAQLLDARQKQDLMSLFDLYREHVDSDIAFDEQDVAELEVVLNRFIESQNKKRFELIHQSPMHEMVFELFYDKSSAQTKRKIKQFKKDIDDRIVDIEAFTSTVKSLKTLKPYLEARHDRLYDQFSLGNSYRWS